MSDCVVMKLCMDDLLVEWPSARSSTVNKLERSDVDTVLSVTDE